MISALVDVDDRLVKEIPANAHDAEASAVASGWLSLTARLVMLLACWLNDRMQKKLDYTQEEVRVLKEVLATTTGGRRIRFTDKQRRRLAIKGKALTPEERRCCCELVTPATILAWFRRLVARKYDSSPSRRRGPGRPRKADDTRQLVVNIAEANPGWSYTKIRDALRTGLEIEIGRTTVANILREAGIEPAPETHQYASRRGALATSAQKDRIMRTSRCDEFRDTTRRAVTQ